MRAAAPPQEYVSIRAPVVALVEELTKRVDVGQIKVQKGDVSLTLEKRI